MESSSPFVELLKAKKSQGFQSKRLHYPPSIKEQAAAFQVYRSLFESATIVNFTSQIALKQEQIDAVGHTTRLHCSHKA